MTRRGTTLMELLIYIGISTIAILVFTNFMISVSRASGRGALGTEVTQNARAAMARMVQDIRSSTTVPTVQTLPAETKLDLNGTGIVYSLDTTTNVLSVNGVPLTGTKVQVVEVNHTTTPIFQMSGNIVTINLKVQTLPSAPSIAQKQLVLVTSVSPHALLY